MSGKWKFQRDDLVCIGTVVDTWNRIGVTFRNERDQVAIARVKADDDDVVATALVKVNS